MRLVAAVVEEEGEILRRRDYHSIRILMLVPERYSTKSIMKLIASQQVFACTSLDGV